MYTSFVCVPKKVQLYEIYCQVCEVYGDKYNEWLEIGSVCSMKIELMCMLMMQRLGWVMAFLCFITTHNNLCVTHSKSDQLIWMGMLRTPLT